MRIMNEDSIMDKVFLISIFLMLIAFFIFYYNLSGITGFAGADFNVSIKSKTQGIINLAYNTNVNLTESQEIIVDFFNSGSTNYSATIEVTVYIYNSTTGGLQQLADYSDITVHLYPGERRNFKTNFLPNRVGTYYIKVRVPYDARVSEQWGSFFVTWYYYQAPQVIYVTTTYGGGTIPRREEGGIADIKLEYDDKVDLYPGQDVLLSVKVNNTGTINLHNLKFQSSTTEYISFEVNPKEVYELRFNESVIFLVSLKIAEDIPIGEYDFFFEVMGLEIKRTGNIELNITPFAKPPLGEEIYNIILNYEYLITELDHEIYLTSLKGFNTSRVELYLDDAKEKLQRAKDYFNEGDFENAKDVLDIVKKDLEDVVFELAAISFRVFIYPAFAPFLILLLLLIIIIVIIIFIYLHKKKKKKKKPKIIKEFTEEET